MCSLRAVMCYLAALVNVNIISPLLPNYLACSRRVGRIEGEARVRAIEESRACQDFGKSVLGMDTCHFFFEAVFSSKMVMRYQDMANGAIRDC